MLYTVKSYLCTNFAGLMDSLETDDFSEVDDFLWDNCQKGYNCEITDKEQGETKWAYADKFNEETVDYADLLMEQQEQM